MLTHIAAKNQKCIQKKSRIVKLFVSIFLIFLIFPWNFPRLTQDFGLSRKTRDYSLSYAPSMHVKASSESDILKLSSGVISWHHLDGYSVNSSNQLIIGHEFDFWNEEWRSWLTLNISALPENCSIESAEFAFKILGKPQECDELDFQLVIVGMETLPSLPFSSGTEIASLFDEMKSSPELSNNLSKLDSEEDFVINQNLTMGLNQSGLDYISSGLTRDWLTFGFYDYDDGGSDSNSDEGVIFALQSFQIEYIHENTTVRDSFLPSAEDIQDVITDDDGNSNSNIGIILIFGGILLVGILVIVALYGPQIKTTEYSSNKGASTTIHPFKTTPPSNFQAKKQSKKQTKIKNRKRNKELLQKFTELLQISHRISIADAAAYMEISKPELLNLLVKWNEKLPFKIDGDLINFDDMDGFMSSLDEEFSDWENHQENKNGKV